MNLNEEVTKEVTRTEDFEFVPARSSPRTIKLIDEGKVTDPLNLIDRWDLSYDGNKKMPVIRLWNKSDAVAFLHLDTTGMFRGRERASNGNCMLRPLPTDMNRWKMLGNPSKYLAKIKPDEREESFIYKEPLAAPFDWSPYEFDISKESFDCPNGDTAIGLIAWNRPNYFRQVVQSLAVNPEILKMPVFCFIDKSTERYDDSAEEQKRILLESVPHAVIIKRPINFGCGRNIIDARRQLFDKLGYKKVFIFEDDMVVSSTYLRFTLNLMEWAEENYSDVGTVQAWNICTLSQEEKYRQRRNVGITFTNRWGYLQKKESWDSVKDEIYTYEKLFLFAQTYSQRPHRSIQSWFDLKINKTPEERGSKKFKIGTNARAHWDSLKRSMPTGQDGLCMVLDSAHGWKRLAPVVNRGLYIGKMGIHMSPTRFIQHGLDKIKLDEFANDMLLNKFVEVK